jgi:toxin ParE1/3/4
MGRVTWTREARVDLDELTDYIARDSVHYARAVAHRIIKLTKHLSDQPLLGRIVPEMQREDIREGFAYSYRVLYQLTDDGILVLAIIHGSRLLMKALENRISEGE